MAPTIRKSLLTQRICALAPEKIRQVDGALKFALDLD